MRRLLPFLAACLLFTTACGSIGPTRDQQVQIAVAETLSSLPRNTPVPVAPPATPYPTFTPVALSGIFCEYQFCIGHPADMAFYDVSATQNQYTPSTYGQGNIAAWKLNGGPFMQLVWQEAPGVTDPQFMIDLILQYSADTRNGSVQPKLVGPLNVFYVQITPGSGPAATLPYGGAAAWVCSGRAFALKTFTAQPELATSLIMDALSRFRCESR